MSQPREQGSVLDDVVVKRLRDLRAQVQRPGEDMLGDLVALFERDSALRLDALRAASTATARRQAAHALKGSAANLGAAQVAALALVIERSPEAAADVDTLASAVRRAIAELRTRLA
ncbi:MAG: Hpt domain-containing protein [Deltaproteobacteria bacterium]|nr:Hpt domain-containing protein [Deltaproteobacteria bacterium]